LRHRLAASGLSDQVNVSSAGVSALDGQPASNPGVEVLSERGMDIGDHIAHTISARDVAEADLILVMEERHRSSLFYRYPDQLHKVFRLSEMAREYRDIEDPYRLPKEEYERCADELTRLLDKGYGEILRRLGVAAP
jgi:protein-tyrosine-phosphatase